MNYYKLINQTTVIGVATQKDLRRYQKRNDVILACTEDSAEYIQYSENLYRDSWMNPTVTEKFQYQNIDVIQIDETEYGILLTAIEKGEEIETERETKEPTPDIPVIDPIEAVTLDYLKGAKINEMSYVCNQTITQGFDAILSDGNTYHFSLTTQDQLNLITLSSMVANGETQIPYHADDELCKFYSPEDINTIIATATQFKTYHVSYFNALKMYVNNLKRKKTVTAVQYGMTIPEEYQSEVLKTMLATGGV